MMKNKIILKTLMFLFVFVIGLTATVKAQDAEKEAKKEKNLEKQRKAFQKNKSTAINEMYNAYPGSKTKLANSYGYAAFANTGVNLFVLASGNGGGMAHNNRTGAEVYVKMISVGAGVGIGYKKYYPVFLFDDQAAYDNFLEVGWSADGQADATADTGKEGEGGSEAIGMNVSQGVTLYQIADKGLAIQATLQGTKFVVSEELNDID
jgi:lipid-binding SYLF domain-containing protein